MKKQRANNPKTKITELTHDTVPATVGLVKEVRDELRADIRGVDYKIDSLSHRVDSVRDELKSDIQQVLVAVHRSQVLMEEQRGENRIVLDGIKNLYERQNRIETDFQKLQHPARSL